MQSWFICVVVASLIIFVLLYQEISKYIQNVSLVRARKTNYYYSTLVRKTTQLLLNILTCEKGGEYFPWDVGTIFRVLPGRLLNIPHVIGRIGSTVNQLLRNHFLIVHEVFEYKSEQTHFISIEIPLYAHAWCILALTNNVCVASLVYSNTIVSEGTLITSTNNIKIEVKGLHFIFATLKQFSCGSLKK